MPRKYYITNNINKNKSLVISEIKAMFLLFHIKIWVLNQGCYIIFIKYNCEDKKQEHFDPKGFLYPSIQYEKKILLFKSWTFRRNLTSVKNGLIFEESNHLIRDK